MVFRRDLDRQLYDLSIVWHFSSFEHRIEEIDRDPRDLLCITEHPRAQAGSGAEDFRHELSQMRPWKILAAIDEMPSALRHMPPFASLLPVNRRGNSVSLFAGRNRQKYLNVVAQLASSDV